MTKQHNIRREESRETLYQAGYRWALTVPRGEQIGHIVSKHRTYEAAERTAKGRELMISDIGEWH